ncbi:MAG: von Willebrand factor type A domain-containing protein [Leeuwenhoekiella sp.]
MKAILYSIILFLSILKIEAQDLLITGVVTDEQKKPLMGVNVLLKGTTRGTVTDLEGAFHIKAAKGQTLLFSFVGYKSLQRTIKENTTFNIVMQADKPALEEVVIVGNEAEMQQNVQSVSKGVVIRDFSSISPQQQVPQSESYKEINENTFKHVAVNPLSTFSIDVDRAAYSNIRRMINNGQEVPENAVKIEEMLNYFNYNYPQPEDENPFSINTEVVESPWNNRSKLVKIGLQGKKIPLADIPASNLVFLLDVSGSMNNVNKLPLLKSALKILVNELREQDKVSIVVYAGAAGVVLEPTNGSEKTKILEALDNLQAGGSTAGGEGINLAYKIAKDNFIEGGNNRVILGTDGDFNVGASSDKEMEKLIEEKRNDGIFLTCLGFGMGNYKDSKLETLADKGNGNHAYIDTMQEARKVLGTELGGTLYTIAKDVKIQVEFNPAQVKGYRLIGYENRLLNDEDFNDDKKDAGEIGSGHSVTALYEIIPVGVESEFLKDVDSLKYTINKSVSGFNDELLTVKVRYKNPDENESKLLSKIVMNTTQKIDKGSGDINFMASVALFGMRLRKSEYAKGTDRDDIINLAENGIEYDPEGYRAEFIRLVKASEIY